jgi:hypothetical protein
MPEHASADHGSFQRSTLRHATAQKQALDSPGKVSPD